MPEILKLTNIKKYYSDFCAIKKLNLTLAKGTTLALLGPNGAGKSTLMQIMLGLRAPTSGSVALFGSTDISQMRYRVGSTPQEADFPPQLTPREILEFTRQHYPKPMTVDQLISDFQLEKLIDRRSHGFSGGEKRRVALALAFVGNPELVFLDEPTNGLDIESQERFQTFTRNYCDAGNTVVLSSHNWQEIERVADHIYMIDQGEKVIEGSIAKLRLGMRVKEVSFRTDDASLLQQYPPENGRCLVRTEQADDFVKALVEDNISFDDISINAIDLQATIQFIRNQQAGI